MMMCWVQVESSFVIAEVPVPGRRVKGRGVSGAVWLSLNRLGKRFADLLRVMPWPLIGCCPSMPQAAQEGSSAEELRI